MLFASFQKIFSSKTLKGVLASIFLRKTSSRLDKHAIQVFIARFLKKKTFAPLTLTCSKKYQDIPQNFILLLLAAGWQNQCT